MRAPLHRPSTGSACAQHCACPVVPYLKGRSIREIAEELGIKTKTAYTRLSLARRDLQTLALA